MGGVLQLTISSSSFPKLLANRADLNASLNRNVEFSILQIVTSHQIQGECTKINAVLHLTLTYSSLGI